jgi:hypothetical protein
VLLLLLCAVLTGVLFRPPRDLREPILSLLPTEAMRAAAAAALSATILLVSGFLAAFLAYVVAGLCLVAAHAIAKQVTARSRAAKMWFNVKFFGNRLAEDLPEDGAAAPSHLPEEPVMGGEEPPPPGAEEGLPDAEEIDLEAPVMTHAVHHRPFAPEKRD